MAKAWLDKTKATRAESTDAKVRGWLDNYIFPAIGHLPIAHITPRDVLDLVRKVEKRGAIDSATRMKQLCGQVFRYAVAEGSAERDVTADLKGALAVRQTVHLAAITEPKPVGELLRAILDEVLGERVDLIEHQLAHAVKDVNGRAYNRTAHLPARKAMMQRWADYLDGLRAGGEVIKFKAAG